MRRRDRNPERAAVPAGGCAGARRQEAQHRLRGGRSQEGPGRAASRMRGSPGGRGPLRAPPSQGPASMTKQKTSRDTQNRGPSRQLAQSLQRVNDLEFPPGSAGSGSAAVTALAPAPAGVRVRTLAWDLLHGEAVAQKSRWRGNKRGWQGAYSPHARAMTQTRGWFGNECQQTPWATGQQGHGASGGTACPVPPRPPGRSGRDPRSASSLRSSTGEEVPGQAPSPQDAPPGREGQATLRQVGAPPPRRPSCCRVRAQGLRERPGTEAV